MDVDEVIERTVFVNAANWPMGEKARAVKMAVGQSEFGGPGFRPVIVDLLDSA
ncbi:hypothetical protein JAAARDRAFT_51971 [Jaapia argillacea MUCL 33604]|uniref:Uncharacterized protein n=1 Tax=Jaapia argillacea MUCL 33604 TaxID=933084 RepID=A0A067QAC1_9AGAM|nr:hypothetical protein JAAARDRAFT_51971 [Jaapia argillacea MUCL 33604]